MKFVSSHSQFMFQAKAYIFLTFMAGLLVFSGCSKAKKSTAESTPPPEAVAQAAKDHMPVYSPTPAKATAAVAAPNGEPDLSELNRAMLRWLMKNRRTPSSFEDFSATAGVAIPPAPAGKKYLIAKDMHVVLVKQ